MKQDLADIRADITQPADRGEAIAEMEPLVIAEGSRHRARLSDQVIELTAASAALLSSLPPALVPALASLVRAMNCYYSNLIEGHNTHPIDIERALQGDYSTDHSKRDLQLEARAHIAVQEWIDQGGLAGRAVHVGAIREVHQRFCALLPADMLWAEHPQTGTRHPVVPGQYRQHDVRIGRHVPISPGAVPRFLARFEDVYGRLGRLDTILSAAAAHHRLLWIHPFLDGNGRVARLITHAMLLGALDTGAVWSVARGFARSEARYKQWLATCDQERRNDLDGRGQLSEESLAGFTGYVLDVCIDQVQFMRQLIEPNALRSRIVRWTAAEIAAGRLPPHAGTVIEATLYRGALPRGDVAALVQTGDRHARRITAALLTAGVLTAETDRAPLRLHFPARLAPHWLPGLFPDQPVAR